jgi:hypothetical protein
VKAHDHVFFRSLQEVASQAARRLLPAPDFLPK